MVLAPATFSLSLSRGASPCCLEADSLESLLVSHDGRAALSKCVTARSAIDAGRGCAPRAGESAFCAAAALCSMAAATATCIVDPRVEARDFPVDGCRRRLFFCFLLFSFLSPTAGSSKARSDSRSAHSASRHTTPRRPLAIALGSAASISGSKSARNVSASRQHRRSV